MKTYSSTTLKYFTDYCPAALGFYEKRTPSDKSIFQAGIAAHAVLQAVGEQKAEGGEAIKAIAWSVVSELVAAGRAFNNVPEPPMNPDSAFEGRDVALKYLSTKTLPEGAKYEMGLAMDSKGKLCDYYSDKARYRAIIDRVYHEEAGDEEWTGKLIVASDYKSAWPTSEKELSTLQRRGQGLLVAKTADASTQGLRMEVVNLRTGKAFTNDIWFDGESEETLKQWESDILLLCDAADKTRDPRPGANCIECPYVNACDVALKFEPVTSEDAATALATLEAKRKDLTKRLKKELADRDRIDVPGGYVGFQAGTQATLSDDAIHEIIAWWYGAHLEKKKTKEEISIEYPLEVGLLTALGLGSGQVKTLTKTLFDKADADKKEEFLGRTLTSIETVKFGVWKEKGGKGE